MGCYELRYLIVLDQPSDSDQWLIRIVLDQRQLRLTLTEQLINQGERCPRIAESSNHYDGARSDCGDCFLYVQLFRHDNVCRPDDKEAIAPAADRPVIGPADAREYPSLLCLC